MWLKQDCLYQILSIQKELKHIFKELLTKDG